MIFAQGKSQMHFVPFCFFVMACVPKPVVDLSPLAIASGDMSAIVEGCGQQPIVGYTYCRMSEGKLSDEALTFHVPPADCAGTHCVTLKVFRPDGQPAIDFDAQKGEKKITLPWVLLLGKTEVSKEDRGFWPFVVRVHRDNANDVVTEGEIRLRVLSRDYASLNRAWTPSAYAWQWFNGPWAFGMTSSGRTSVGHLK